MRSAVLGLIGFLLLISIASALYPGGTVFDPQAPSYSFWNNYYCDLVDPVTYGGRDNVLGAWVARAAFASFALALWQFWPMAAGLARPGVPAKLARVVGRLGAATLIGVASIPAAASEVLHAVVVTASAGTSIVAALVLIPALVGRVDRVARGLGACVALSASVTLLQYLQQGLLRLYFAPWLPGAQKVTSLLMLAWMARLLWQVSRRDERGHETAA